jgi:hypothetical protein
MTVKWRLDLARTAAMILVALTFSGNLSAYSVLTHEEIVDLAWTSEIQPLLLQRFPDLTVDQIKEAHAYAYGGSVIQDLGYYPFGSKEFSAWFITFAAAILSLSCCAKVRMPTSTLLH